MEYGRDHRLEVPASPLDGHHALVRASSPALSQCSDYEAYLYSPSLDPQPYPHPDPHARSLHRPAESQPKPLFLAAADDRSSLNSTASSLSFNTAFRTVVLDRRNPESGLRQRRSPSDTLHKDLNIRVSNASSAESSYRGFDSEYVGSPSSDTSISPPLPPPKTQARLPIARKPVHSTTGPTKAAKSVQGLRRRQMAMSLEDKPMPSLPPPVEVKTTSNRHQVFDPPPTLDLGITSTGLNAKSSIRKLGLPSNPRAKRQATTEVEMPGAGSQPMSPPPPQRVDSLSHRHQGKSMNRSISDRTPKEGRSYGSQIPLVSRPEANSWSASRADHWKPEPNSMDRQQPVLPRKSPAVPSDVQARLDSIRSDDDGLGITGPIRDSKPVRYTSLRKKIHTPSATPDSIHLDQSWNRSASISTSTTTRPRADSNETYNTFAINSIRSTVASLSMSRHAAPVLPDLPTVLEDTPLTSLPSASSLAASSSYTTAEPSPSSWTSSISPTTISRSTTYASDSSSASDPASNASNSSSASSISLASTLSTVSSITTFSRPCAPAPALTVVHTACFQAHANMRPSRNDVAPVACMACRAADGAPRWTCAWCSVRLCEPCVRVLASTPGRDVQRVVAERGLESNVHRERPGAVGWGAMNTSAESGWRKVVEQREISRWGGHGKKEEWRCDEAMRATEAPAWAQKTRIAALRNTEREHDKRESTWEDDYA